MLKIYIATLLLVISGQFAYAEGIVNQNPQANDNADLDIKDQFTDEDGNIVDPYKIPSLKTTINNWKLLIGNINERKVCYAVSKPFAKVGNHKDMRDAYLMVIYWNKLRQSINISMGFTFKPGSKAKISVDGRQFAANTKDNIATPGRENIDSEIVKSMLYSKKVMVKGDSKIGTYAVDAYVTDDFQDVYAKLVELCDFV